MCEKCKKYIKADGECSCDNSERKIIKFIHEGNFDEIFYACENCGKIIV